MNKMTTHVETAQITPPRLITSLRSGFDAVATHIGLILFPVILDLFLWFGPHFSLKSLLLPLITSISKTPGMDSPQLSDLMSTTRDLWQAFAQQFNLASLLRTYPIGIPSLESGLLPQHTPLGSPITITIPSMGGVFMTSLVLYLIGLVGGSLYFAAVAGALAVKPAEGDVKSPTWSAGQTILLALGWLVLLLVISIPGVIVITILALISPVVAQIGTLLLGVAVIWLLVPLLFSPHGIFMFHQNALTSMLNSVRLVRVLLPGTGLFFLTIVILSQGLDLLWQVPPDTSWMSLVAIAGHGFVTTALVAASFAYYRDATTFVRDLASRPAESQQTRLKI